MKNWILVSMVIFLVSSVGRSEEFQTYNEYLSVGFRFDHRQYGSGVGLEFESPVFYSFTRYESATALTGFLSLSTFRIENTIKDDSGNYIRAANTEIYVGVRMISPMIADSAYGYVNLGVSYLNLSDRLVESRSKYGGKFALGGELPIGRFASRLSEKKHLNSLFIETAFTEGVGGADKLSGNPNLFNETSISMGVRIHY